MSLNRRAFDWGRILAAGFDIDAITATPGAADVAPETLDEVIAHRARELTAYQNAAYAQRYRDLVTLARRAQAAARPGSEDFAMAVAVNAYRLMAYKDEYEVARLYSSVTRYGIASALARDASRTNAQGVLQDVWLPS